MQIEIHEKLTSRFWMSGLARTNCIDLYATEVVKGDLFYMSCVRELTKPLQRVSGLGVRKLLLDHILVTNM